MKKILLILIPALTAFFTYATSVTLHQQIKWTDVQENQVPLMPSLRLHFEGAVYDPGSGADPWFRQKVKLDTDATSVDTRLFNAVYQPLSPGELLLMDNPASVSTRIQIDAVVSRAANQAYAIIEFFPVRLNMLTGRYEKLISFDLEITATGNFKSGDAFRTYADNSVLATGNWFRIKVQETGIYKVTYEEMSEMGMAVSGLSSGNIRLYGNGGGMLPEPNSDYRPDDLLENAIALIDGGDNVFNPGDYFLFYGESPDEWKLNSNKSSFEYHKNIYDDYNYYFITTRAGQGKRIENLPSSTEPASYTASTFNDYAAHESENLNLIKSGRRWLGETFDFQTSYDFVFDFPNLNTSAEHYLKIRSIAKSALSSTFVATINGTSLSPMLISGTPDNPNGWYAKENITEEKISLSSGQVNLNLKYNKSSNNSIGWLDYIRLNVVRNLVFSGGQMGFRDINSIAEGRITQFSLGNAANGVTVWEVTNPDNVKKVGTNSVGNSQSFTLPTDMLREFIAFDGSDYFNAEFDSAVANQNLHNQRNIEYVIVSHPDFLDQANRLADFHRDLSGLMVLVTTPEQVYNEFSSGAQDITAIKDMMRMFYERGQQGDIMPRYLLLFGDASYDYKNRVENNTNFIPAYESPNSLHYINSYATDDYFGALDPDEGSESSDLLDIGIGRMVVTTPEEAESVVDKIIHYATSESSMGIWRKTITFVGDDEDGNVHMNQAEQMAVYVDTTYPDYNVDKIYIDSYLQETTPGGQRYPEVNNAINSSIEKGTLIMNYTGHGGEVGWAHERILEIPDINNWTNFDKLSVFVTATCEFARYDDPGRVSAGEHVFLNPRGGAVALFTTARATFGGSNLSLNRGFYKYAFEQINGHYYTMGDLIRLAKLESTSSTNDKKFILIGDPALKMAYPDYRVETISINQGEDNFGRDTLRALSKVTIRGKITDVSGNTITDFNGHLHSIVFDKASEVTTLGQDESSSPRTFMLRNNTIYNGFASVENGEFLFSFIVPKDISYSYGPGKISYYAQSKTHDASGYNTDIIIGGYNDDSMADDTGPEIELYMNDTTFRSGDITHENPVLLARVFDESGINTVGNSIGHDITAVLNDNTDKPYNLNEFYESDMKGYQSGTVSYPFSNLPPGEHEVKVRIWDVHNNSSEAALKFVVIDRNQIAIRNAYNRPNPFANETWFEYNHNQANETVDVEIEIFDLSGRLVTTLQQINVSSGFYPSPIRWDGTAANGNRLDGGIYIYRVQLRDKNGQTTTAVKKLVIAR
jgi:hypothetical protein